MILSDKSNTAKVLFRLTSWTSTRPLLRDGRHDDLGGKLTVVDIQLNADYERDALEDADREADREPLQSLLGISN